MITKFLTSLVVAFLILATATTLWVVTYHTLAFVIEHS